MTFPDPYGSGQEAIQPPPGQAYDPPPPSQGFNPPPRARATTLRRPAGLRPGAAAARVHGRAPGARRLRLRTVSGGRRAAGDVRRPDVRPAPAGRNRAGQRRPPHRRVASWPSRWPSSRWASATSSGASSSGATGRRPRCRCSGCGAGGPRPTGWPASGAWRCARSPGASSTASSASSPRSPRSCSSSRAGSTRRCTTGSPAPWSCTTRTRSSPADRLRPGLRCWNTPSH